MAEIDGLEPDLALQFFLKKGYNAIKEYYMATSNTTPANDSANSEEPILVSLLMECVNKLKIPIQQVCG